MGPGVAKLYWYGWDFKDSGGFYDPDTQALNPAGVAYEQIVKWTTGGTVSLACRTEPVELHDHRLKCVFHGHLGYLTNL